MISSRLLPFTASFIISMVLDAKGQNFDAYNGLDSLGERISARVNQQLKPLENLGSRISEQVTRQVSGLENLGSQISQSVYHGLEPVRAMEVKLRMRDGVGGTTIATYYPSGKIFLVKNHQRYTCDGIVDQTTGDCNGKLELFQIKNQNDWCYGPVGTYTIFNNYLCLSTGGSFVQVINGQITCKSTDNGNALFIKLDDYKHMCKDLSTKIEFKYIANENDPHHVPIPNSNSYVRCSNNEKGVCLFTEETGFDNINANNVYVNSNQGSNIILYSN